MANPTSDNDKPAYHHGDLRSALLAAGETVLSETGVEGFSLRRVARLVGVSHAAPAHHFGDANGLLAALATEGFRRFLAAMQARQAQEAQAGRRDARAMTVASGLGYVDFAASSPALFRLMFSAPLQDCATADLSAAGDAAFAHLAQDIARERALPDTGAALADPAGRADIYATWSMVHGYANLLISGRIKPLADVAPAQRDAFLRDVLACLAPARADPGAP